MGAKTLFLAVFFVCPTVLAQSDPSDAPASALKWLQQRVDDIGEWTGGLVPPRDNALGGSDLDPLSGKVSKTRPLDQSYPVRPTCLVSVANRFGEIRVGAWDNPVVRVRADVTVGAASGDLAAEVLKAINIDITQTEDHVGIRAAEPPTSGMQDVVIVVNYDVMAPQGASLTCENYFGDTVISGLGGAVTVDSTFGTVDLRNLAGPVAARALGGGEFLLHAHSLRQGGTFDLRRTHAQFSNVAGLLRVNDFMGAVVLRDMPPETDVHIDNYSGPVHLYLAEEDMPDLEATVRFGSIKSDFPLKDQTSMGDNIVMARHPNVETSRHATVTVAFDDLVIHREGLTEDPNPSEPEGAELVRDTKEFTAPLPEGLEFSVNNLLGDIRLEGADTDRLRVRAVKRVRLQSTANAAAALDALEVTLDTLDHQVKVETRVLDNMETLGCTYYRVDLEIECPRTPPLRIIGSNGHTSVEGVGGPVQIEQMEGGISVVHVKGEVVLTNHSGDARVDECGGPLTLSVTDGAATTRLIRGRQTIACVNGKTVIDEPRGPVAATCRGGDVRIIAAEGVEGDYDVQVDSGNLSVLLAPTADASLQITAVNGIVYSTAVPLEFGSIHGEVRKYQGKLNDGTHKLTLVATGGDVLID